MLHEPIDLGPATLTGLRLDASAPPFAARTTQGHCTLDDYHGRWLVLFSHPADFTPVCTSEFIAFEKRSEAFDALNCALLGLSVDSVYSHLAWLDSIKTGFGVTITFPVIDDVSMAISHAYGMIHDGSVSTATVRSVFFIDPAGILRAVTHYPMRVGRSVDEILRVVRALQITQAHDVSLPEGWTPGQKAVLNPVAEDGTVRATAESDVWYYQEVDLPDDISADLTVEVAS